MSLGVDEGFQFALYEASEKVRTDITPRITQIVACNTGEAQPACATRFAQTFGAKAFRRPLEASEVTRLMTVFTQGMMQDFNTAIGLMIQSVIISPSFIYRTELGPTTLTADASGKFPDTTLTPHEIATQLGFLFTGSTPDAALLCGCCRRQPGDHRRHHSADRSPVHAAHDQGPPDRRDHRLVQRPADLRQGKGHSAAGSPAGQPIRTRL